MFHPDDVPEAGPTPRRWRASNFSIVARPDGGFRMVQRSGQLLLGREGVLGPYEVMGTSVFVGLPGLPQRHLGRLEDPVLWLGGGLYHMVVNHWRDRRAYHLISRNGVAGRRLQGLAYEPGADSLRYAEGTVNRRNKLERPAV